MKSLAIIFTIATTIFTSSAFAKKAYQNGDVLPCGKIYMDQGLTLTNGKNTAFFPAGVTYKQIAESSSSVVNKRQ